MLLSEVNFPLYEHLSPYISSPFSELVVGQHAMVQSPGQ